MYYDMPYMKLGPENKDVILITTGHPLNFILAKLLQQLVTRIQMLHPVRQTGFILKEPTTSVSILDIWGPPHAMGSVGASSTPLWRVHEQQLHLQHTGNASSEKAGCTACNEGPKCYFSYNVLLIGSQCCQYSNRDTYGTRVGESTKSICCYHF